MKRRFIPHWIFRLGLGRKFEIQGHRRMTIVDYFARVAAPFYGVTVDELFKNASALAAVGRMSVPVFQLHAVDDWIVPVEHAARLRAEARRLGNELVGVCIRSRGAHCAFRRVFGSWRSALAREFFLSANGMTVEAANEN